MSELEAKALTIAREKIREVGWANYNRKHNPPQAMCVMEGIEYAVSQVARGNSSALYADLSKIFREANKIDDFSVITWNDDKTGKKTKRDIIKAFNYAIDYAKR